MFFGALRERNQGRRRVARMRWIAALAAFALLAPPLAAATYVRGSIVPKLVCAADEAESYAYYLPSHFDGKTPAPVLFIFDPRGRGDVAAELFRAAAEERGWILISSNDTRSDVPTWDSNLRAVRAIWNDAATRFPIDPKRVYLTGFSGTAGLAWLVAAKTGAVAGIIASGGHAVDVGTAAKALTFDWYGFSGNGDFNNANMRKLDADAAAAGLAHRVAFFDGGHRWAPPARTGITSVS